MGPPLERLPGEDVKQARLARKEAELSDFRQRAQNGTTVVLDLEWEDSMQPKELKSLIQQILYCYGANRRATHPVRLVFSGVQEGSQTHAGLSKQSGYESWEVQKLSAPYVEAFPKESLVYLTADAEATVQSFDPSKVYVIGGIVDRNRLKGRTMQKALDQGIASAQLPLAEYIEMGSYSRVLTVNHVMNMVLDHQASQDWRGVCERCVPGRKVMAEADVESAQAESRITRLDLSNCGLHATGLELLQKVLLDLEHRGAGHAVEELVLDSNDVGDAGTVALAGMLRLSGQLRVLRLRNIGITDGGFGQIISTLVTNKSLGLLDLRGNGLCTLENSKIAVQGVRRFNRTVQVLL
ncbi:unnamed protein product [Effrenium voratum]|nr:unnamed protein product [Effrenium voratum]